MNISIKKFEQLSIYELYEIMKLRAEIFVVEQNCVYQDMDGSDYDSYHLTMTVSGEMCAYLRIPLKGVTHEATSIGRVVVSSKHRDKGYGRIILEKAIEFITETLHEDTIQISAQEYLEKFYSSLGFKTTSEVFMEDGIPHIPMEYKKASNIKNIEFEKIKVDREADDLFENLVDDMNLMMNHVIIPSGKVFPKHDTDAMVYLLVNKGTLYACIDGVEDNIPQGTVVKIPYKSSSELGNKTDESVELFVTKIRNE